MYLSLNILRYICIYIYMNIFVVCILICIPVVCHIGLYMHDIFKVLICFEVWYSIDACLHLNSWTCNILGCQNPSKMTLGLVYARFQLACWWLGLKSRHELRGLRDCCIKEGWCHPQRTCQDHVGPVALVGSILGALLLSGIHAVHCSDRPLVFMIFYWLEMVRDG